VTFVTAEESLDFVLEFAGPALEFNEMRVDDLAPALLSAARLFQVGNRLAHPADREIQVNITATRPGSFAMVLKLIYDTTSTALHDGQQSGLTDTLILITGLIGLRVARKRNGRPQSVEPTEEGMVRITFPNGVVMTFPAGSLALIDQPEIQIPLEGLVAPMAREGIDSLRIESNGEVLAEVESDDRDAFEPAGPSQREVLLDTTSEIYLTIRTVAFDSRLAWRFSDNALNFAAKITDPDFNARVDGHEAFAKGDTLRCLLRIVQSREMSGAIFSEYEVVRVLDHNRPFGPPPTLFTS